jgi:hypothetical protein
MADLLIALDPSKSDANGVFGDCYFRGTHMGVVCGQPWNDNKPGHSCIPPGEYEVRPHDSPHHPDTVVFVNPDLNVYEAPSDIPPEKAGVGRSECLLHNANWPSQLQGCFAPGKEITDIPPHGKGVTASVDTLNRIRELWGDRHFTAEVRCKVMDQAES